MKALYCGSCGDLLGLDDSVRSCECGCVHGRWFDGARGLALYAETSPQALTGTYAAWYCWGLGIHNARSCEERESKPAGPTPFEYRAWQQADGYLFKQVESMIVRFRPGVTSDTRFVTFDDLEDKVWA